MVISGVYNDKMELIPQTVNDLWNEYDKATLEINRPEVTNILKQIENLSNSTTVKRIIIKDESGTNRVIIGNLDV